MAYNNKFIAVIKCKGKILREFSNSIVQLPFGADYSILLKNKSTQKALVDVKIDGNDVLDGNSIIVDSNGTIELKGFMKGNSVKNKFRFIKKTDEISKYRGNFIEDGLVEVLYRFEKDNYDVWPSPLSYDLYKCCDVYDVTSDFKINYYQEQKLTSCNAASDLCNDNGITVHGTETCQNFVTGSIGLLENKSYSIIINLKGKVNKKIIKKPVTTKSKVTCPTCGRRWKSNFKYCGNCSTYLK